MWTTKIRPGRRDYRGIPSANVKTGSLDFARFSGHSRPNVEDHNVRFTYFDFRAGYSSFEFFDNLFLSFSFFFFLV